MWKLSLALTLLVTTQAFAKGNYRDRPCTSPKLASTCFQTHARLWSGNGTPSTRLWPIGTHRIFGIYSNLYGFQHDDSTLDNEAPKLPSLVNRAINEIHKTSGPGGWTIYGDFEICPLEPHLQGHMQAACIAHASNVAIPKDE